MEQLTIKQLKNRFPRAAKKLESHFNRESVDFIEERANILQTGAGKLRCRVMGGKAWHRVDWDSKRGTWRNHESVSASAAA